ncbi:MAG: nucleotide exchange factor GrpE [Gammaproteobacteria bacterium]
MSTEQDLPESQTTEIAVETQESDIAVKEPEEETQPQAESAAQEAQLSLADLQKQLNDAQLKAQENWDKAVRAQAEMENIKRRAMKDLENAHKFALEKFAKELLQVIDSLELGIQASNGDSPEVAKLREGSELTLKQFQAVFAKFNIETVDSLGQPFNPELHQAMAQQPSAEVPPNTVTAVYQKGYTLNGRLLRPAMVVVSKAAE